MTIRAEDYKKKITVRPDKRTSRRQQQSKRKQLFISNKTFYCTFNNLFAITSFPMCALSLDLANAHHIECITPQDTIWETILFYYEKTKICFFNFKIFLFKIIQVPLVFFVFVLYYGSTLCWHFAFIFFIFFCFLFFVIVLFCCWFYFVLFFFFCSCKWK